MPPRPPDLVAEPGRIKLEWLVKLHWIAILGESAAIVLVQAAGLMQLPLLPLGVLVGISAASNLGLQAWLRTGPAVSDRFLAGVMLFDTAVLTGLLHLSGGHFNPFSTLYLVNVALAAVLLPPRWSWTQAVFSVLAFGALFPMQQWAPFGVQDHEAMMAVHLYGMLVAVVIAAAVIVLIVQRVSLALRRRDEELARERRLAEQRAKLASLVTLAAGAAHELATPLGAIAVAAKELDRALARAGAPGDARQDVGLIRDQVARCKEILQQMSARAGENAGEPILDLAVTGWVDGALDGFPGRERVRVEVSCGDARVRGPVRGLERALRVLLRNALQASPPGSEVRLAAGCAQGAVAIEVVDGGPGMPPEVLARAGEPFFTTKEPGQGSGLGIYIARTLAEQLGGSLEIRSAPGRGTAARIELPVAATGGGEARG
ncbi:MAG TPA: ATP-binding protein [Anaeromyxobacteraceae bacterium]|nr:ATP-binding protein [Anaeromyxobacteraceae bacterium]